MEESSWRGTDVRRQFPPPTKPNVMPIPEGERAASGGLSIERATFFPECRANQSEAAKGGEISRGFRDGGNPEIVNRQPIAGRGWLRFLPANPERPSNWDVQKTDRTRDLTLVDCQRAIMRAHSKQVGRCKTQRRHVD